MAGHRQLASGLYDGERVSMCYCGCRKIHESYVTFQRQAMHGVYAIFKSGGATCTGTIVDMELSRSVLHVRMTCPVILSLSEIQRYKVS